ncbi:hypothetical protein PMIN01_04989 [Paraphaeosphaeria minitans]|uniref:Uncharacterized protein n=1 Tax=Paraphaeosphaeria minitans TaxID=565426 RepID=A0A9P6GMP9_9PLEO|nr:hypothetical protein PMIN01_04989 [Paraphaeosphaeria minitans]
MPLRRHAAHTTLQSTPGPPGPPCTVRYFQPRRAPRVHPGYRVLGILYNQSLAQNLSRQNTSCSPTTGPGGSVQYPKDHQHAARLPRRSPDAGRLLLPPPERRQGLKTTHEPDLQPWLRPPRNGVGSDAESAHPIDKSVRPVWISFCFCYESCPGDVTFRCLCFRHPLLQPWEWTTEE